MSAVRGDPFTGKPAAITILPFQPTDQAEVKALILSGLAEHWGALDPHLNPDLNDIAASYENATFLVAWQAGRIVGTGALVPRAPGTAEIVRMSVRPDVRRQGIGGLILERLIGRARSLGCTKVILETTATWHEVIAFYLQNGFYITHRSGGDVYFALELA